MGYALVNAGVIVREQDDPPPPGAPKAGYAWLPVEVSTVGTGSVASTVTTVLADKVTRVTTRREQTAPEIDAAKAATVETQLGLTPAGRALKQAFEALFFIANDVRSRHGQGALTLQQFKTAVEGLNSIPDQAFYDWIKGKL